MTKNQAIQRLKEGAPFSALYVEEWENALNMAIEALQERKSGKWIDHSADGYVECPFCGHLTTCEGNIEDLHYCFWCGAKMEVD